MAKKPAPKKYGLDIFRTLGAIDNHDFEYFNNLSPEEQKGYASPVVMRWVSSAANPLDDWALMATNDRANMHHYTLYEFSDLQYKLLASVGMGRTNHKWIKGVGNTHKAALYTFLLRYYPDANDHELEIILKYLREGTTLKDFLDGTGLPADEIKRVRKLFD